MGRPVRLKLASRKSDLARWQAVQVGRALEVLPEKPSIEFLFKSSLGDQNLDLPLASMGSKGVFTEDFYEDLTRGACDLVVHSWKDLPTEERPDTHIAMTLPRADVRDVIVVPDEVWMHALTTGTLEVLTSSPRRVYNLGSLLPKILPGDMKVSFKPVRGNVPTRLKKMREENAALVLAKAGLDRLLQAEATGFLAEGAVVRAHLDKARFMVLPISANPPAPAQGALAIEVARTNDTMNALCAQLNEESTFRAVKREREILCRYGGGCHQKIGVAVLARDYGTVLSLRGLTEQGEVLHDWRVENQTPWTRAASPHAVFPTDPKQNSWFERTPLAADLVSQAALFVARENALPETYMPGNQMVWAAGLQTWEKLARRGIWVSGCQDGLGEKEPMALEQLAPGVTFTKVTHARAGGGLATYKLENKTQTPDLKGKTHFFWMSHTSFERARELFPDEIRMGHHACGPGATFDYLKTVTGLENQVKVFIGLEQFLRESLP